MNSSSKKLLMIPGPIEFEPAVLRSTGAPTPSHVAPDFINCFADCLEMMKKVWLCPSGQPFIIAGTGTLAMEMAGANLTEPGDNALVISTGYFGERFAELLKRFGAKVTILSAPPGEVVPTGEIESALKKGNYKLMTFTHVDTSTGVRVDPKTIGELGKAHDVLTVLDGVCSVGGEELRQEEWGIDVALTASQKAIGVPPGLALMVVSQKAVNAWKNRKTPVGSYYCDWNNWLPVMEAYSNKKPSYFGTPPVNLIMGLDTSLKQILKEGVENRFARHKKTGEAFRAAMKALNLKAIPKDSFHAANTMSAPYFPENIKAEDFMSSMAASDVTVAPGLLPKLKGSYFRVGHMGAVSKADILSTVAAIEAALKECNHKFEPGTGLIAVTETLD